MSNQVFVGANMPSQERDAEALRNIWKTYAHEATEFDHFRIASLHKSLDVRLIFVRTFVHSAETKVLMLLSVRHI